MTELQKGARARGARVTPVLLVMPVPPVAAVPVPLTEGEIYVNNTLFGLQVDLFGLALLSMYYKYNT